MKKHFKGATYDLTQENMNGLIEQLEDANAALFIASEALIWCEDMLRAWDEFNANINCAPLRHSALTERVIQARKSIIELRNKEIK